MRQYTQEELALIVAMEKKVKAIAAEAKAQFRDRLVDMSDSGVDRLSVKVGGEKVGQVTLVGGSKTFCILPEREEEALDLLDSMALVERRPKRDWQKCFWEVDGHIVNDEGEVCDGLIGITYTPLTTRVTGCKESDVVQAFRSLGGATAKVAALLEEV